MFKFYCTIVLFHTSPLPPPSDAAAYGIIGWCATVLFFLILIWTIKLKNEAKSLYSAKELLWDKKLNFEKSKTENQHYENDRIMSSLHKKELHNEILSTHISDLVNRIYALDPGFAKIENLITSNNAARIYSSKNAFTESELKSFSTSIALCKKDLFKELHIDAPELTEIDNALFGLITLGIKNQDIAILLNISEGTLRQREIQIEE